MGYETCCHKPGRSVKRRSSNLAPFFFANSRTLFASAMGSSFKKSDDTQETESLAYFRYARLYETGWEFRELYTCYNRSKFEVMHSLDVPERSRKLNVFMGWITGGYQAFGN